MPEVESQPDWSNESISYEQRLILAEEDTRLKVSSTISALETAIEAWKAADKKPEDLRRTMVDFQNFLEELSQWEKESLLARESTDVAERELRLMQFTKICEKYRELGIGGA